MRARAWIFNHDELEFEHYAEERGVDDLVGHTTSGETIVHRGVDGMLTVIEGGQVKGHLGAGDVLEVLGKRFTSTDFR